MNREEAIRRICVHNRIHAMREPTAILITEALDMAIDALLGPQPDPITGLMPCGCGGEVVRYGRNLLNRFTTGCSECGTLSWSEFSQEDADKNWNNSRGYRDL